VSFPGRVREVRGRFKEAEAAVRRAKRAQPCAVFSSWIARKKKQACRNATLESQPRMSRSRVCQQG